MMFSAFFKGRNNGKFINCQGLSYYLLVILRFFKKAFVLVSIGVLGTAPGPWEFVGRGLGKNKLIDIGLRGHSLGYWKNLLDGYF
jgi:hypothetical protein